MTRACPPFKVALKVTSPLLDVIVEVPVKLTALGNVRGLAPVIVMFEPT
jgi:hypothetical protein